MRKKMEKIKSEGDGVLLILYSYHHNNTEKVANVMGKILNAQIRTPQQINPEDLHKFKLIGFGSGMYGEKHHKTLLDLAEKLLEVNNKKAFLFSTSATTWELPQKHSTLKKKLEAKGYSIIGDFYCKGFNTNSFLKYFGGMNKNRPNASDLESAENFARQLKQFI